MVSRVVVYVVGASGYAVYLYAQFDISVINGTFETNKYDLLFVNIISITVLNTVLPVTQCFLPG